ncbi:uncharacterized protein DNG_04044 [Cephalotrichum gorgonifer]|uniref:F-box domain-containing protein n=1 Tax=Cephalotrichum gorgonifer TaxID=2041049 RepID=A0AAE8MVU3_9PEZI|nr:uncharacterized protein DNG_04044 [Cephalotrichum gorgonifer]
MAAESNSPAARTPPALGSFPNEIILHILYFLPPEDNLLAFQLLSSHLSRLANTPSLWRYHCSNSFKYWNPDHEFQRKLRAPVSEVDWKRLFLERKQRNERIALLFDGMLATRLGRMWKFEQVCHLGYDAKDFLVEQCHADESLEDVLARRYYANAVLDSIHKEVAIKEWARFASDVVPLLRPWPARMSTRTLNTIIERNLAAFDMFILHDQTGDVDEVITLLDNIAAEFQSSHPDFDTMSTRDKALALNRWLRHKNLLGMESPALNYRRLRNCFLGQALRYAPHDSLPLISSVIYCSVAGRLGLDAQPCLFPSHVHALVLSPPGESLDGQALPPHDGDGDGDGEGDDVPPGATLEHGMHLDPYGADHEVPRSVLNAILSSHGWDANRDLFLTPASPVNLAMRTAHNIRAAFTPDLSAPHTPEPYAAASDTSLPASGASALDRDAAFQAYLWARLMLLPPSDVQWVQTLHRLLGRFVNSWAGDVWLVERYLLPLYDGVGPGAQAWDDPLGLVRAKRQLDTVQPLAKGRAAGGAADIGFRVGDVVRHKRLNFVAIVTGWADDGSRLDGEVVDGEDVYAVPMYYRCLRGGSLTQVQVLQESIIPYDGEVPPELFEIAGMYFKRFDAETGRFVSNIREEYPDD